MFKPAQLESFLAVAQTLSFTQAADQLGVRQSTISQHVRQLEATLGKQMFLRDTHTVELTPDGEAMVGFARTIVDTGREAVSFFAGPQLRGRLRFGASEDFVATYLTDVLRDFRRRHPGVELELTVGLSGELHRKLEARQLDLVFGKRQLGAAHGQLVWRDRLVWVGTETTRIDPAADVPLILYPEPSVSRAQALETLQWHGRGFRIACTSTSLSGLRAAVLAGLGVTAHTRSLIPHDLVELGPQQGLPALGEVEFVLSPPPRVRTETARALGAAIIADANRLRHAR
jgi:DNA-binding transcriptional LysR family regulator